MNTLFIFRCAGFVGYFSTEGNDRSVEIVGEALLKRGKAALSHLGYVIKEGEAALGLDVCLWVRVPGCGASSVAIDP